MLPILLVVFLLLIVRLLLRVLRLLVLVVRLLLLLLLLPLALLLLVLLVLLLLVLLVLLLLAHLLLEQEATLRYGSCLRRPVSRLWVPVCLLLPRASRPGLSFRPRSPSWREIAATSFGAPGRFVSPPLPPPQPLAKGSTRGDAATPWGRPPACSWPP